MSALLTKIPEDIPQDIRKIRIENSHLTELPRGSFSNVSALEYLWLNFNNITVMHLKSLEDLQALKELRLQGNKLSSVPWTAFQDTPALKILDLKHNRLDVLPEHALRFLPNLTYLDLSSNQLTVISRDVFSSWPVYQRSQRAEGSMAHTANAVLALHGNPWICDCRLRGFVQFIKSIGPPIILMNSYLTCSSPKFREGKFFHEVELNSCMKPLTSALETNLTVPVGLNVTLTCYVQASPSPTVWWTYAHKLLRAFNVSTEPVGEETLRSELRIAAARPMDAGSYSCWAANFLGNASVGIALRVGEQPLGAVPATAATVGPAPGGGAEGSTAHVEVRIAKQTVYGITLEWRAAAAEPGDTWYTLHLGRYDAARKDTVSVGPGVHTYSVGDLLPATKYEVCVAVRDQAPRKGQCVVFVTGSDVSQLEQREKLIHIVVIICAMVLAVPAGMYACTAEARPGCVARGLAPCRRRRRGERAPRSGPDSSLDSLPGGSEEGLCQPGPGRRPRHGEPERPGKARPGPRNSADLY
ncbi:leucine-rich repeat, immunoglobulin-like domain and transmembrane domain-containing protein 2 [Nothoprocta perdicaria]|nr:leucine-rich repeat, immunoglobulin-like domain and transmembrane domain-containing protein 2 [Nothoprocta perdicaria]